MWIVRLALHRPYTFIVIAILLFILGPLAIMRTPTDIFPDIDIPVVSIVWSFNGFSAEDMAHRITSIYERALTSDVDDIEHIESQSLNGVAVIKVFFHPGADINRAIAEAASNSASILRVLPPGTLPPNIITYNASTVPVLQLGLSSDTLPEQTLYDLGNSFIRTQLATVQGAAVPLPFGGKIRQVMVDIDPRALQAKGLAPIDVVNAVNAQNLILPGGTAKIGTREYNVQMNGSTQSVAALNNLPVKTVKGGVVYVRDVAQVRDGYAPQTNIVRSDGKRAALLEVEKSGSASTLTIISQVKAMLPKIAAGLPKALTITPLGDQSVFVRSAITGVVREAAIAACLTAAMILLFLGSWRATLIIAVSIPLAVLTSLIALSALGQTINIMTLGGLALAVGILVDDATVAIENITHHLENGEPLHDAILNGSGEIAAPTFVSTLAICIVFLPMFLLSGVARYLFVPMAEAVVFAMIASYFFSRTLIPTLAMYLLRASPKDGEPAGRLAAIVRFQRGFEQRFEKLRRGYYGVLQRAMENRRKFLLAFLLVCLGSLALLPFAGRDFFPAVDTGEIRLHLRAPTGTRIEETARLTDEVEEKIRTVIPQADQDGEAPSPGTVLADRAGSRAADRGDRAAAACEQRPDAASGRTASAERGRDQAGQRAGIAGTAAARLRDAVRRRVDLCAHQRLSRALVRGHRHQGEDGRDAGRDPDARTRRAIGTSPRRRSHRAGQLQLCARHLATLAADAGDAIGVAAGRRHPGERHAG